MTSTPATLRTAVLTLAAAALAACASSPDPAATPEPTTRPLTIAAAAATAPDPDPRIGLRAGVHDAGEAIWNLRLLSNTPSPEPFAGVTNSDLAFMGPYAIQGNYNGFQVWDISDPRHPVLEKGYFCPASQSDVSVYRNLLFVSGEGLSGRIDCGGGGVADTVSADRLRGLRIFDISDLDNPVNVGNVQTCRGSHTHTVLVDPNDREHVYVYISGSAGVRSPSELPGCETGMPDENPNTALFRIEVIRVPVANPARAAIVSSPRIFDDLEAPPTHGEAQADIAARVRQLAEARRTGAFIAVIRGTEQVLSSRFVDPMLDSIVAARGATGAPTRSDSAALRAALPELMAQMFGTGERMRTGPTQCHDITVYPAIGLAGGACGGYGLLLDIRDPEQPRRIDAVADSNFSYWHSATFSNDGTKVLFTDEWGGGGGPKCRATDPKEWGANAIFTLENGRMVFQSYYKLPAAQTELENCVAHNGSLIPIPGRDVMVQGWYQGGISVFDWTDPRNPVEIAFFDRGPLNPGRMTSAGSWSVYWYNGVLVSSEIARGLDILELTPSAFLTRNEIDAANTVELDYLNVQGQPKFTWPPSFALARAYLDQLARSNGLAADRIRDARQALVIAEGRSGDARRQTLTALGARLRDQAAGAGDPAKVRTLAQAVRALAGS
ncbi:MAG TPA: hypothetical protein VMM12_02780 [Longimicrobiales bacterium]|nr:hypothetical protein [Longimicrobiales bacterium]